MHTAAVAIGWALLVDLGGDDTYRVTAGGNVSARNSVSVLLDLGGDDHYGYVEVPHPLDDARLVSDADGRYTPTAGPDEDNGPTSFSQTPRQGGGRMGTATLVDLGGGDDEYRSLRLSQGTGVFGTGVLVDDAGDDVYLGEAAMQGAAAFGIGLLYDGGGNDERRAYQFAQGFAYARAAGAIYDVDGDDVYFLDPGDPDAGGDPVLSDVDLEIGAGERVAFVGPTGAGKSTLAKLIARFYDPTAGTIHLGDTDLRDVAVRALRDEIVVVPQEGYLFSGSVAENIRVAKPDASDADVRAALERIGVLDRLLEPVMRAATSTGRLVSSLVVAAIGTNALAADQYIAIVLPGKLFQNAFARMNLRPEALSRAVGDSATVTSALIPWNSCGAYMAATLGVATIAYAPFAFFNLLNPFISIALAFAGVRMMQEKDAETGKKQAKATATSRP